jgi:UrcA family protein
MYTKTAATSTWSVLCAATLACTLFAGNVAALDREVTVAIHVSTGGLHLSQRAGAQKFYWRLEHAADEVCTRGNRVGLAPASNPQACYEQALADAIRSANMPLVTQFYLAAHTLSEASARGISAPANVAAK